MIHARVKQHYQDESIARSYDRDRFASPAGRALHALEGRAIRGLVRRVVADTPNPSVLDLPCGTGRITELLLESGLEVTGGDISLPMIDVARERCGRFGDRVSFRRLDLDALDLPDWSFDLVTCVRLFHHLESPARGRILRELSRVTRRHVLVNVAYSSPYYRLRRRAKRAMGQGISMCSSTWGEIVREASEAGLTVERTRFAARGLSEDLVILLSRAS